MRKLSTVFVQSRCARHVRHLFARLEEVAEVSRGEVVNKIDERFDFFFQFQDNPATAMSTVCSSVSRLIISVIVALNP